jgi:hypothetical protein
MPRAALLSLHARVEGVAPDSWEDPALVQVWGPRWAVYVVARKDVALFTVSRYPDDARSRSVAQDMAAGLLAAIGKRRVKFDEAASFLSGDRNRIRYASATGTVAIRWDGARQPDVWLMPRPAVAPADARREVARRHLHVYGPATAIGFARWLGIDPHQGRTTYAELAEAGEIVAVTTPMGDEFILASDEASVRRKPDSPAGVRLLPSGDAFTLMKGADRELLVPDATNRGRLWTPRVWPGAVMVDGEICGTWRRDQHRMTISAWRRLSVAELERVESEALSFPLPGLTKPITVTWEV